MKFSDLGAWNLVQTYEVFSARLILQTIYLPHAALPVKAELDRGAHSLGRKLEVVRAERGGRPARVQFVPP
eukprot:2946529-Prymnesium_polylepis.1